MIKFLQISDDEKRKIYQDISNKIGVPPQAVEKDVWVTLMLRMVFKSNLAPHFIFKGGTSLSKAFYLIKRFSEDIDLGIDRRCLGFEGDLSKGQIRKLRRASHTFVSVKMKEVLKQQLDEYGVDESLYELVVENEQISDQDPETILVNYKTLYDKEEIPYLLPRVKIEVSARSLIEPNQPEKIKSWIEEQYPAASFVEESFDVSTTNPQKTFIEKLILLHEEFEKPKEKIRYLRMSRHFYDIRQILNSEYGQAALQNTELFESIIAHRKVLTPMKTTNYENLTLHSLNIIPPDDFLGSYKSDYKEMQENMIHGESLDFDTLLNEITEKLKEKT
jgi:hypothetical protein